MSRKPLEYLEYKIRLDQDDTADGLWASKARQQIERYKERRLKYHIENMFKLLELHISARRDAKTPTTQ